jgi:ubiquinone/menaquinone biosynthesis C-methylase UbiE
MRVLNHIQRAAQEQFSLRSQWYAKGHILGDIEDVEEAVGFLTVPSHAQVLDAACGAGNTGLYLADHGYHVTCADLSEAMLKRTRETAEDRGLSIETRQHPAEEFPYADASFDLVTCRVAAHHFSDPERFVREVVRVLKSGGSFLLIDGMVPDGDADAGEWLNRIEKLRDPSHVELYASSRWWDWCTDAGLIVTRYWRREKKQPDLQWYFDTAGTSPENRAAVLQLIADAPPALRAIYRIGEEEGRIVWWWPMLSLIARK